MSKNLKGLFTGLLLAFSAVYAPEIQAQRIALKTNVIDWVALSPNLTMEARVSRRISLQLGVAANPFDIPVFNTTWRNYRIEPEMRYWFNRPMARHFIALSGTAAAFNFRHDQRHIVGDAVGAGLSYGYALVLSNHWNMECEIGAGVAHASAFNYTGEERPDSKNLSQFYIVPIRLGLSFSYIFK